MRSPIEQIRRPQRQAAEASASDPAAALVHLLMTLVLIVSIVIAATAVTMGRAFAQTAAGLSQQSDVSLVVMLLVVAIALMGALSAIAVRLASRPRHQAKWPS